MEEISIINIKKPKLLNVDCEYGSATINNFDFEYDLKHIRHFQNFDIKFNFDDNNSFNKIILNKFEKINLNSIFIYSSDDNLNWEKINIINTYLETGTLILILPLTRSKYVNIIIKEFVIHSELSKFIGKIDFEVDTSISASSNLDRLWVAQNLLEWRNDYGWSSVIHSHQKNDIIDIDFNCEYYISKLKLRSIDENNNCFPEWFFIELSSDKILWNRVISEEKFTVSRNKWYVWSFSLQKCRYIRIIANPARMKKNEFVSKILSLDVFAIPQNTIYQAQKNYFSNIYASELFPGLVKLAENNSNLPGVVVQGSDFRLREATTEYSGIIQLAKDGESNENIVVQGNDSRLREATTQYPGITQFAKDGESRASVAVQGNDSRLREATTQYPGITQFAKDGESRASVAVQGNDSRLREATTQYLGIAQFAKDGESRASVAVQGNDSRLREATTQYPGIAQFAKDGESNANVAVQGNDSRLREATTENRGRVQLARNGENSEFKVVQANDDRIQPATIEKYGTVLLANHGVSLNKRVVQSDDPRLSDLRDPKPHQHEYANKIHDYNSHSGTLNILINKKTDHETQNNYYSSTVDYPFSIENKEGLAAGIYGGLVVSAEKNQAMTVFSNTNIGLDVISREKNAAIFLSEKDFAISLPGKNGKIAGSKKAIYAEGLVDIRGGIQVTGSRALIVKWNKFSKEIYSEGDLLTINESGELEKIKNKNQQLIGIFTKNTNFTLSNSDEPGIYIALSGIVQVKVMGKITCGDKIGYSDGDPGVAQRTKSPSDITALDSSENTQEKLIWCLIR